MDAFYASVEQRDHPELRNRPVAVGGSKHRGVVAAASYEARKYGVKSAMPSAMAYKRCPDIVFVKPRFEVYKAVSQEIRAIFHEYTDLVEPLSLDEAYLDVTENKLDMEYAMDVATAIKEKIKERTNLTASAGVSYNKFLAKIASDYNKPNGFYVVTPKMADTFIEALPIEKFFGVGKVTAKKMHLKGIFRGKDLKQKTQNQLTNWFGKSGNYYYHVARGIDNRQVNPNRIRKSLGAERTYDVDIKDKASLAEHVLQIVAILIKRIEKNGGAGKSLTLKVKYADFRQITRSRTLTENLTPPQIKTIALELVNEISDIEQGIRLVGLQTSNFENDNKDIFLEQLEFDFDKI